MDNTTEQVESIIDNGAELSPETLEQVEGIIDDGAESTPETGNPVIVNARQSKTERFFAKRVTSVFISDASIRITVARGHEIEKWVNSPLEPGVVVNGIITDPESLGTKLADLQKRHEINKKNVIVGLSGLNSITRVFSIPSVPNKFIKEAINHEAERELPVPLQTVYLSWQVMEKTGDEIKVFLIAYARNAIDPLMSALKKADIKPYFMELAPLALARSVSSSTCVIFDVRPGEMDIVVMIDNIPELSRSVPLPMDSSAEANLPIILEELHRTILYYQSENSIVSLPVFGFGDLDPQLYESLSQLLDNPISISYPPLYYAPEFLPDNYCVNIGLSLEKIKLPDIGYQRSVSINMLPEQYLGEKLAPKLILAAGTSTAVAILVAGLFMWQSASAETDSVRSEVDTATQELIQHQSGKTALEQEADYLQTQSAQKAGELTQLVVSSDMIEMQQAVLNNDLELILHEDILPPGVSLTLISDNGGNSLTIEGLAPTEQEILEYTSNLETSQRFSDIILSINAQVGYEASFEMKLIS